MFFSDTRFANSTKALSLTQLITVNKFLVVSVFDSRALASQMKTLLFPAPSTDSTRQHPRTMHAARTLRQSMRHELVHCLAARTS